ALTLASATAACSYIFDVPGENAAPVVTNTNDGSVESSSPVDVVVNRPEVVRREPPPPFCVSQTVPRLFCGDFDEGAPPDPSALGVLSTKDGHLAVVNALSLSPPRSLLATVTGTTTSASVEHTLPGTLNGVVFSFGVLVSAWQITRAEIARVVVQ